jgi:rhodanese-related sulfurtransferase
MEELIAAVREKIQQGLDEFEREHIQPAQSTKQQIVSPHIAA